jgi:hypothetical protein
MISSLPAHIKKIYVIFSGTGMAGEVIPLLNPTLPTADPVSYIELEALYPQSTVAVVPTTNNMI